MPGEIVYLTTRNEVTEYLTTHPVVIMKFTATWCGPCKRSAPLVNNLFAQMHDNVSMIIVDIDKARDISSAMKVKSVPTLHNFINGRPMDSVVGANDDSIISFFNKTNKREFS
uniref:Thioredoxin domain-containing protein n=1 Tax=viral metagenome TaxID=1070528 RepID=A0A6C0C6E6_9ZZZZ